MINSRTAKNRSSTFKKGDCGKFVREGGAIVDDGDDDDDDETLGNHREERRNFCLESLLFWEERGKEKRLCSTVLHSRIVSYTEACARRELSGRDYRKCPSL